MTVTTFSELELDESLLEALQDKGFTRPTAIQAAAIPPALDGRDVLGSAPTGTGKTAAYLLPALQHLLDFPRKKSGPPRILILTPTRELAMQVADHARELAKHTHLDIATITGGVAYMNHAEVFSENQDIVVATTGRLLQYIKEENFDCRAVETLILDEADRMLDMGFAQDIEHIAGETRWRNRPCSFRQRWKAMRFRTLPSVCWKIRWKFLPIPPPVSAKKFISGITAPMILSIKPRCWCIC
jgi:superfamily II DNA/RNA helicase